MGCYPALLFKTLKGRQRFRSVFYADALGDLGTKRAKLGVPDSVKHRLTWILFVVAFLTVGLWGLRLLQPTPVQKAKIYSLSPSRVIPSRCYWLSNSTVCFLGRDIYPYNLQTGREYTGCTIDLENGRTSLYSPVLPLPGVQAGFSPPDVRPDGTLLLHYLRLDPPTHQPGVSQRITGEYVTTVAPGSEKGELLSLRERMGKGKRCLYIFWSAEKPGFYAHVMELAGTKQRKNRWYFIPLNPKEKPQPLALTETKNIRRYGSWIPIAILPGDRTIFVDQETTETKGGSRSIQIRPARAEFNFTDKATRQITLQIGSLDKPESAYEQVTIPVPGKGTQISIAIANNTRQIAWFVSAKPNRLEEWWNRIESNILSRVAPLWFTRRTLLPQYELYISEFDGSHVRYLGYTKPEPTQFGLPPQAAWSPDGKRIGFYSATKFSLVEVPQKK